MNPTDSALDGDDTPVLPYFGHKLISDLAFWEKHDKVFFDNYCTDHTGYPQLVLGNKWDYPNEGRTYMSSTLSPGPKGWDKYERKHLNNHALLQCGG